MLSRLAEPVFVVRTLARAGMIQPERPDRLIRGLDALRRWGPTIAGGYAASAARRPDATAIIDERGSLTFGEVERRANAVARGLAAQGVRAGDGVAILARNHRGFIDATVGVAMLGANALYLNTMFAGPQIAEVCEREQPVAIVYDEEFAGMVARACEGREQFIAWSDGAGDGSVPTLEDLIARHDSSPLDPPAQPGRVVILTSGTTGAPKGAQRKQPDSLSPVAALLGSIPLRARGTTVIAAPLFHSWGMAHFLIGLSLGSTLVLRRRFDPAATLGDIAANHASALVVVPVMLQRIMELPPGELNGPDVSSVRVIAVSGSALPGELALRVMDHFGPVLYNLYGSTEVSWATIAGPADLRAAPGTAGRPPHGTTIKLFDADGREVPAGKTGRIFVGNDLAFEGYTGGGGKEIIEGLLSTGDVGHLDGEGRLFVDGRDDEMIVSGGENVFPREVEDLLADHDQVVEAAVVGVTDDEWGQRLRAVVVRTPGGEVDESELQDYVKKNLARYKVPREVLFVDELPRNATGKVLKRALADDGASGSQAG